MFCDNHKNSVKKVKTALTIPRNDLGIPEYEMESLARILLPIMQEYLASEEGKRDYAEWKARKKQGADGTEKNGSDQENKLDEIEE